MSKILRTLWLAFAPVVLAGALSAQTCSVTLNPTSASNVAAAGASGQISVSSPAGCQWTSSSNASWLTITYGQGGTQNGTVGWTAAPQDSNTSRSGTITINDKTFTVTQSAGSCQYALLSNGAPISSSSFPADGGGGAVDLSTLKGCPWQATTLSNWISILTPSGNGPSTINFTVAPSTTGSRTGSITVQSERLTIQQSAPCSFSVGSIAPVSGNGGALSVTVTASSSSCSREVLSQVDWITVNNPAASGSTAISLTIKPNTSGSPRVGNITINGMPVPINQLGNSCTFTLSPNSATAVQTGGVGTVAVQTQSGCVWTVTSQSDWLTVTSAASGTGNGTVTYAVGQNLTADQRTGFIAIGNTTFRVTQAGLGCTVRVENSTLAVGSDGGSGVFTVSALTTCSWQVSSDASWLKVTSGAAGTGSADVTFAADPNPTSQVRIAHVLVGATVVTVTQAAGSCRVAVGQTSISMGATGGSGVLPITANCAWTARSSAEWIVITSAASGSADSSLQYQVQPNNGADDRTGTITIAGQAVTITQSGQRCSLTLSTTTGAIPARGGNGSFSVTGGSSCSWSASAPDGWLQTSYTAVNGAGTVRYSAPANTTGQARVTVVSVGGQQVTITQPAIQVTLGADGVLNAATFAAGSVAPGEIITIYGAGFGPALLANLELTANRQNITSLIGDTRVLFDGVASPMVYVVDGQLSAIVPYAVAGKTTTVLEVEYFGVKSNAVTLQVAPTAPGIFTLTQNGKGQGAVLNQDSSLNGPGSAAAQRNSVIQIFATGEGQTRPGGVDGKLAVAPLPAPLAGVRVFVGGVEATVTYAGASSGLVAGLVQVNARIPANAPLGDAVSLEVRFNNVPSPSGVTIGVRQ